MDSTYNRVDTREVLQHEKHVAKEETPEDLVVSQSKSDRLEEALGDVIVGCFHHFNLLNDILVGRFEVSDPAQVLDGLLTAALAEEPAWCLSEHQTANQNHAGRDELDGKGNEPLCAAFRQSLADSKIDPEANQATCLPTELIKTDETTSDGWRCNLRQIDGNDHGATTDSPVQIFSTLRTTLEGKCAYRPEMTLPA